MTGFAPVRLTQLAAGGGCACKIPAGQLEELVADLRGHDHPGLLVGLDDGQTGLVEGEEDPALCAARSQNRSD